MTKKSAARLMRDEQKKEVDNYFKTNSVFDDLHEVHSKITANISQFGLISQLANNQELITQLDNPIDINNKITLLSKDLTLIINDLNKTFESHKEKTGGADNPDDYMWALTTFQNYSQIASVVEGSVLPTVATIYQEFAKAEEKLIKLKENEKATDSQPNTEVV